MANSGLTVTSNLSLHTRYRPQTLEDVIGQPSVIKSLKRTIKDGRSKCFLFVGPPGTGKTTLSRILASSVIGGGSSHNIIEHDAASKSGKADMQALVQSTLFRAVGGSPIKFVIIDECHKLSTDAWIVLLKPTEEPPAHVYYAFCTTDIAKVPKANITRCQRYDLKPVKEELLLELLVKVVDAEGFQIDDEILEAIAENAKGSPRQALVYLESCLSCKSANEARAIMRDAGQSKGLNDFCRWLIAGKGLSWPEAMKFLPALQLQEPENTRLMICGYLAAVLQNTKSDKAAVALLEIYEAFSKPYYTAEKMAPLFYSIGVAMKLGQ